MLKQGAYIIKAAAEAMAVEVPTFVLGPLLQSSSRTQAKALIVLIKISPTDII